jgi:serine-type D-Ala-D-Ala carboxypeptidase (penicillin-binding protein 5/6)
LHLVHGFVQPTGVRSRLPWLPCLLVVLGLLAVWTAPPAAAAPAAPRVEARTAVVMDAATGAVVWQRGAHRPVLVAGTRFGYRTGWLLKRQPLLTTLLLASANDAAETLAAAHPGGRAGFLRAMQAKGDALGCTDSTWRDPSGLDAPGHRGSAADLAVLGRALLGQPELAKLVGSRVVRYRWPDGHVQFLSNHNHFVGWGRDPGALGIKTGYTIRARSTIVAAQRRGGRTLVAVALGSDRMYDDVRSLFAYGFRARPKADAEVLGVTADPEAEADAPARDSMLPPAAERVTGRAGGAPAPLFERLGLRLLALPLPLAAAAAAGCLVAGVLALVWLRPGRRHH